MIVQRIRVVSLKSSILFIISPVRLVIAFSKTWFSFGEARSSDREKDYGLKGFCIGKSPG